MAEDVTGCEALVCALLSEAPDIPNAADLILRAAVATKHIAEVPFLRCGRHLCTYAYAQRSLWHIQDLDERLISKHILDCVL